METLEKVLVEYDEMFCDEISIKLLYQHKNKIEGFVDENNNQVSKSAVADWIMENYYNDRKFVDRKSTRLNSSHDRQSRMPSSA